MTPGSIAVVGSANMDMVGYVSCLPAAGETVLAERTSRRPGGKGANQAVAAARLGLETSFVGAVGADQFGEELLEALRRDGVEVSGVRTVEEMTGLASIVIDATGESVIIVSPGANSSASLEGVDLSSFDAVLCQLEIPLELAEEAASKTTGLFCLNASPMRKLSPELLERCDLVVVNEPEYEASNGQLDKCPRVVLTLGAKGAVLLQAGQEVARSKSPEVDAVDGVGAGDAFVAALVAGLIDGLSEPAALERACRAGSLAVSRQGTQDALPYLSELD